MNHVLKRTHSILGRNLTFIFILCGSFTAGLFVTEVTHGAEAKKSGYAHGIEVLGDLRPDLLRTLTVSRALGHVGVFRVYEDIEDPSRRIRIQNGRNVKPGAFLDIELKSGWEMAQVTQVRPKENGSREVEYELISDHTRATITLTSEGEILEGLGVSLAKYRPTGHYLELQLNVPTATDVMVIGKPRGPQVFIEGGYQVSGRLNSESPYAGIVIPVGNGFRIYKSAVLEVTRMRISGSYRITAISLLPHGEKVPVILRFEYPEEGGTQVTFGGTDQPIRELKEAVTTDGVEEIEYRYDPEKAAKEFDLSLSE